MIEISLICRFGSSPCIIKSFFPVSLKLFVIFCCTLSQNLYKLVIYICAVIVKLFFKLVYNIIIQNHFIFFIVLHVKIFNKVSIIIGGFMIVDVFLISRSRNVWFKLIPALYIHICEGINRWVREKRYWDWSNSLIVAFIKMHMRTDLLVTGCHF